MKTYIINLPSPWLIDDRNNLPLGALFIHEFCRSKGCDIGFVDLSSKAQDEWKIPTGGLVYGFSCNTPQFKYAARAAAIVKARNSVAINVFGGTHPTFVPEILDYNFVDNVIAGEGETAFYELISGDWCSVENIDEYPFPKLDSIELNSYRAGVFTTNMGNGKVGTQLITSRGCPYNCRFCSSPAMWGRKVRFHSAEYITEWVLYLKRLGFNNLYFVDDSFVIKRTRLEKLCKTLRDNNILWRCNVRGDSINDEVIKVMYDGGCRQIDIGVETGSQRMLGLMKKSEKVEDNVRAVELAKKQGIIAKVCFMVGLPGENQLDINDTIDFIENVRPDSATLCTFVPFPGCYFWSEASEKAGPEDTLGIDFDKFILCGSEEPRSYNNYSNTISYRYQIKEAIKGIHTQNVIKSRVKNRRL